MHLRHRLILTGSTVAAGALAGPAFAQSLDLSITIPRLSVAEYHKPYVAVWLEKPGTAPRTLSVWYETSKDEGRKYLSEIRGWWRASGRSIAMPADGISGATRAPGIQTLSLTSGKGPLGTLAPGAYTMVVEAARETGGRETVRLPFSWPPRRGQAVKVAGTQELGAVTLTFKR